MAWTDIINCVRAPCSDAYEVVALGDVRPGDWVLDATDRDGRLPPLQHTLEGGALLYMMQEPFWWAPLGSARLAPDGLIDLGSSDCDLYFYRGISEKTDWRRIDEGGKVRRLARQLFRHDHSHPLCSQERTARAVYEELLLDFRRSCTEVMGGGPAIDHRIGGPQDTDAFIEEHTTKILSRRNRAQAAHELALAVWRHDTIDGELSLSLM